MKKVILGIFFIAFTTLLLQLTLIRVLDVVWHGNMAYMIITLALFSFGVSGVYYSLNPLKNREQSDFVLSRLCVFYAFSILALFAVLNFFPFKTVMFEESLLKGSFRFVVFFFSVSFPFFFAGLITTTIFSNYIRSIQIIYFWDLLGAALGTILIIPFVKPLGGGGLIVFCAGICFLASAVFSNGKRWTLSAIVLGIGFIAIPFVKDGYLPSGQPIVGKRGVHLVDAQSLETQVWDPISKIDVIATYDQFSGLPKKHVSYDGGSQSSYIYQFDGDYEALRAQMPGAAHMHFWERQVLVSHFLKRDTGQEVLVLGSAGGQEMKAALTYNAKHVDGIELVDSVVKLLAGEYADFSGGITLEPNVNNQVGEGRSFLRLSEKEYDIIQIFSNHTSSSIAAGNGAMAANYLQTIEAYESYFSHLSEKGILHINHHVYPRMIATASRAWKNLGKTDFEKHVMVWEASYQDGNGNWIKDNLPTTLVKNTPWTEAEVTETQAFFGGSRHLRIDPVHPENNYLPIDFFSGDPIPQEILNMVPYRIDAVSDNDPYFNFLRKSFGKIAVDNDVYASPSVALLLNSQVNGPIPSDVIHIVVSVIASFVFSLVFLVVPLLFSKVGRERWEGKPLVLVYFSCLGAGFIVFEVVFIQLFMKLIGYPLYAYACVVFTFLLAAGIGSNSSQKLRITEGRRALIPYLAIAIYCAIFMFLRDPLFDALLVGNIVVRCLASFVLIFPLGFFLGMPFPMGCLELVGKPDGAVSWAWAMNGLFTTVGGFGSILLSIYSGYLSSLLVGIAIYLLAMITYVAMRNKAA